MSAATPQQTQPAPLAGDAARQAMDAMAGYDYQIVRTVEAWLQLGPDETIFIECAEDYDVVGQAGAVATQIKSSPENITLNSQDVREAVRNFWALVERNTGRGCISMRFLSRGSIGREQKSPLGEPGLLLWRKAAAGDDRAAQLLRDHLIGQGGSETFVAFLRNGPVERIRAELFGRIEWVTNEPSLEAVRLSVSRLAINLGAKSQIPPSVSERAVPALLDECRQVAVKKQPELRSLTRADALRIFEKHTSLMVPITTNLMASMGNVMALSAASAQSFAFAPVFDGELPELPIESLPRSEFVAALSAQLRAAGSVLIVGAEGEGKSTAANLLARCFEGAPFWMDLRGGDELVSAAAIENALVLARGASPPSVLTLDDVPAAQGVSDLLWGRLRVLIDQCRRSGILLAMTSRGVPANAVDPKFLAAGVLAIQVPRISEPELVAYLESLGCDPSRSEVWARMTLAHTGNGHPKLVHLAALELRDRRWAGGVEDVMQAPRSVEEARVAARQQASKSVRQPDRDLLFALTLTTAGFSREFALRLGGLLSIDEPGSAFDRLDGRWVERIGPGLYRATPLLQNQAPALWPAEKVAATHKSLFDAYMATKSISLSQTMAIFLHAFQAQDGRRMTGFLTALATHIEETEGLAEALELLVHIGAQDRTRAIPFDSKASLLLRHLQFRVARARRPELLADMARRWQWEIDQETDPVFRAFALGMRGMSIGIAMEGEFPAQVVVEALEHADSLLTLPQSKTAGLVDDLDGEDPLTMIFLVAQSNYQTASRVADMVHALEEAPEALRGRLLQAYELALARGGMAMFDRAMVHESEAESPDWAGLCRALERATELGRQWNAKAFEAAAARILSIVLAENLGDHLAAVRVLEQVSDAGTRLTIKEQMASVAYVQGDFDQAIRLWGECLLGGDSAGEGGVRDPFAMRKAGIACAKRGRLDEAARWFERAANLAEAELTVMPSALFRIDASQCWFRHGSREAALDQLGKAWLQVSEVIDPDNEPRRFAAQKFLGNLAGWMWAGLDPEHPLPVVVWIGGASRPDLDLEAIKAETPTELDVLAGLIARLAAHLGLTMPGLDRALAIAESSTDPVVEIMCRAFKLGAMLRDGSFDDVGVEAHRLLEAVARQAQLMDPDSGAKAREQVKDIARYAFALALCMTTLSGGDASTVLDAWNASLPTEGTQSEARALAQEVFGKFNLGEASAMDLVRSSPDWVERIASASIALSGAELSPREMAQAQWVLALYLTSAARGREFLHVDLSGLADAFARQWVHFLATPALLSAPRVSVPALQEAIAAADGAGMRLLRLARAAGQACGQAVPSPIASALHAAAGSQEAIEQRRKALARPEWPASAP